MNPIDARELGIRDQQLIWVEGRRGKVITRAMLSERINRGSHLHDLSMVDWRLQ